MPRLVVPPLTPGTLSGRDQPEIPAGAVTLRPWTAADAPGLVAAYTDPDIRRWHCLALDDEREALGLIGWWRAAWTDERGASWAVTDTRAGGLLGRMALRTLDLGDATAEVAYWVVPAGRGRGVAREGLRALTRWAFTDAGLQRLELFHSVHNPASCKVAVGAGFSYEGVARGSVLHQDGWHDMHQHARLRTDPDDGPDPSR
jgi:RimJ/RimL family protein N-acetyltransferase